MKRTQTIASTSLHLLVRRGNLPFRGPTRRRGELAVRPRSKSGHLRPRPRGTPLRRPLFGQRQVLSRLLPVRRGDRARLDVRMVGLGLARLLFERIAKHFLQREDDAKSAELCLRGSFKGRS